MQGIEDAYRRYGTLLFSVAANVLRDTAEAEDCVHDVLVRLWNNPASYSANGGSLRAFLVVCVRNEAISRLRKAARRSQIDAQLAAQPAGTAEIEIEDFIESARLRDALTRLPKEQRDAVVLAYFGGKTHTEVAHALNEPLGTVKSRISQGLRKLGAALGKGDRA